MSPKSYIGTAAWTIPKDHRPSFTEGGSHLEMYGGKLNAAEINSSFYRDHKPETYERWAASVPEDFRFSADRSFFDFAPTSLVHLRQYDLRLRHGQCLGAE
jgi:hypothetical protein